MPGLQKLHDAIVNGDAPTAVAVTREALGAEQDPQELVSGTMIPAMDEVGRRFEAGEFFVPELLIAARAMKGALELLRPALAAKGTEPVGRVVMGTVEGDLHDIGKNLVVYMLEGGGFEVTDLGTDVKPADFVRTAKEKNADLVGLSALLTTTMPSMRSVVAELEGAGLRDRVRVMIGGAPITEKYAREIGADGYRETAVAAVALARELVAKGS